MFYGTHINVPAGLVLYKLSGDVLARPPGERGDLGVVLPIAGGGVSVGCGGRGVRHPRVGHHSSTLPCKPQRDNVRWSYRTRTISVSPFECGAHYTQILICRCSLHPSIKRTSLFFHTNAIFTVLQR